MEYCYIHGFSHVLCTVILQHQNTFSCLDQCTALNKSRTGPTSLSEGITSPFPEDIFKQEVQLMFTSGSTCQLADYSSGTCERHPSWHPCRTGSDSTPGESQKYTKRCLNGQEHWLFKLRKLFWFSKILFWILQQPFINT